MSRSLWFALPALAICALPLVSAPVPKNEKPVVEIVFCLDTTGSLGGMLEGVRKSFWAICNRVLSARPTPDLRVGVVAFRDRGDEYVTKVFDLTDDLDAVYLSLLDLSAAGGGDTPEHVNAGLHASVERMSWSRREAIRIVYLVGDARPHLDYADDVEYPITCKLAVEKGIAIHTLQCGQDAECTKHFAEIARLGKGSHVVLPLDGGVAIETTVVDNQLVEVHRELMRGAILHGSAARREQDAKKVDAALALSAEASADRVGVLARAGRLGRYDLIDAGLTNLDEPTMLAERRADLETVRKRRAELFLEAHRLANERAEALGRRRSADQARLDVQVLELLRKQAGRKLRWP